MSASNEYRPAATYICPREGETCPDSYDVYNTSIAFSIINMRVPEDQAQDRIPDYLCEAANTLLDNLSPPDTTKNERKATPQVLLDLFGPITARALVIAAIYALEMSLRTDPVAAKWRFVVKELGVGRISS